MTDDRTMRFTVNAPALRSALELTRAFTDNSDHAHPLLENVAFTAGEGEAGEGEITIGASDKLNASLEVLNVTGNPFPFLMPHEARTRILAALEQGPAEMEFSFDSPGRVEARTSDPFDKGSVTVAFPLVDYLGYPNLAVVLNKFTNPVFEAVAVRPRKAAAVLSAIAQRGSSDPLEVTHLSADGFGLRQGNLSVVLGVTRTRPLLKVVPND